MKKKIFKYSIIAIAILIITIIACIILNKKDITFSRIFGQTKGVLNGTQTYTSDELEYNTDGDDSANYKDGDTTKEKSGWVQNGDTWTYTFYVDDPNAQWYIWEDSETLMDGYSGDFTENNVGTLFTEETLNEFTPDESYMAKKEIEGKNVYTWLDSENAYKVTDNGDGTYTKITTKLSFTITNTKEGTQNPEEAGYGSLTINKVVKDKDNNELTEEDDNTNFTFTVTLTADTANSKLIEGTKIFGNMVFKNGVATVSLKAGKSVTISEIPAGISYSITENQVSGYDISYSSNTGTIAKDTESVATITNTKTKTLLTINKVVKDSEGNVLTEDDDDTNFTFTVKLTADSANSSLIEGTKTFGNMVFKNGVATISLKAGGSVTISDIPVGVSYNVTENAVSGYETSYESATGTISKNVESITTITNKKIKTQTPGDSGSGTEDPSQKHVDITLKKAVTGNYENDDNYNFEIALANLTANTTYKIEKIASETANIQEESFTSDDVGSANVSVSLKNDEYAILKDIPVGAKYKVFEYAGEYISSYSITDTKNLGKINNTANVNTKPNKSLSTGTETADEDEEVTITFTNKKELVQNLKIAKEVTSENDTNTYTFEIAFSNMGEGTSFNSTVGKVTADQEGEAILTMYLAGGEEAEFYNVPVGTKYQITELASTAIASYIVVDSNGLNKVASEAGANSKSKKALSTEQETVNEGEEVTVTFINDTVNLSEEESAEDSVEVGIGVTKVVLNRDNKVEENCKDTFTFELRAKDEGYPMPEGARKNGEQETSSKIITITGNGTASFGTITFTETGTYTYVVTERAGDSEDYTYDNTTYTVVYEVTNPEGLLEVTKTVKKNGFRGDAITFTNVTTKEDTSNQDDKNDDGENKSDEGNDNVDNKDESNGQNNSDDNNNPDEDKKSDLSEKQEKETNKTIIKGLVSPKTGDLIILYIVVLTIALLGLGFVMIIRKNKNR